MWNDLHRNPLFSCQMIYKQYIVLNCVFSNTKVISKFEPITYSPLLTNVTVQYFSLLTESFDVAVFTVYSVSMNVNDLFTLTHFHLFQLDINSKYTYNDSLTQCTISEYKTGNNVSKFTYSNCITLSYYSSPKHKSLIPKCLIQSLSLLYTVIYSMGW